MCHGPQSDAARGAGQDQFSAGHAGNRIGLQRLERRAELARAPLPGHNLRRRAAAHGGAAPRGRHARGGRRGR